MKQGSIQELLDRGRPMPSAPPSTQGLEPRQIALLRELLGAPGPSGAEQPVQSIVSRELKPLAEVLDSDLHGNVWGGLNTSAPLKILVTAHCDQIGFMVKGISENGFLYVSLVGGGDEAALPGTPVLVHTKQGPLPGIIGKKATHLESSKERNTVPTTKQIWIDIGARDRGAIQEMVCLGDYATFAPTWAELRNDLVVSPALDNRAGLFVALEVFRMCAHVKMDVGLLFGSTVQEELGMRGAATLSYTLHPQVALVLDVANAQDDPGKESKSNIPCNLGSGPCISSGPNTNPVLGKLLKESADEAGIPYQLAPSSDLEGNDAKIIQVSRGGVATAAIGLPNRNMHTAAEVCSLVDLAESIRLLTNFITNIHVGVDFRPFRV